MQKPLPDEPEQRPRRTRTRKRRGPAPRPEPAPIPHIEMKALEHHGGFTHTRGHGRGK